MADYSGAYERTCCNSTVFNKHQPLCKYNLRHNQHAKAEAANMKYSEASDLYYCMNGCGCAVWDVEAHLENVCRGNNDARHKN